MPPNPSHQGLVAQGWNWTLSDAKPKAANGGVLNIGQMYITESGKTEIDIVLNKGRLSPILGINLNGSAVVDWGDGTEEDTIIGYSISNTIFKLHDYASEGAYTITIDVDGQARISGNSSCSLILSNNGNLPVYDNSIHSIHIGNSIDFGDYAFNNCCSLSEITIPDGVTSIGQNAFNNCNGLANIYILPTVPPTLANKNAFDSLGPGCIIYVPAESVEAYKTANNWSNHASKIQAIPA